VSLGLAWHATADLPLRVDVNGRLLRMRVEGAGTPTVVLEIGLAGSLEEWAVVQREAAKFVRVVSYDRQGARQTALQMTGRDVATELHAALAKAGFSPPYLLVGQSFGGVYNRIFASMYPNEVVGMLLLDPSQEKFIEWMKAHHPTEEFSNRTFKNWPEATGVNATLDELRTSDPLPDVLIVVVTAAKPNPDKLWQEVRPVWAAAHDEWAKSLPQGRHVVTEQSGHGIHVEQPELVVELLREMVDRLRRQQPPAASSDTPTPASTPDAGSGSSR
jgi:pimeloyl-ACP methyl ester carboxylesterase